MDLLSCYSNRFVQNRRRATRLMEDSVIRDIIGDIRITEFWDIHFPI